MNDILKINNPQNLFEFLLKRATDSRIENKILLTIGNETFKYNEIWTSVKKFSCFLNSQDIGKGEKIIVLLPNDESFIVSFFSILSIGAVAVLLDINLKKELEQIIKDTDPKFIITTCKIYVDREKIWKKFNKFKIVLSNSTDTDNIDNNRIFSFKNILDEYQEFELFSPCSLTDNACILYTSGTTGFPKGIFKTHLNLITEIIELSNVMNIKSKDRFFSVIPWFHVYGMIHAFLLPIYASAQIFFIENYTPRSLYNFIINKKISIFVGVPVLYHILFKLDTKPSGKFEYLRFGVSSGSQLSEEFVTGLYEKYGLKIIELYGSTETGGITINHNKLNYPNSVGKVLKTIQMKICNKEGKNSCKDLQGTIFVKGSTLSSKYIENEKIHELTDNEGWYNTNDVGFIDDQGYLFLLDRSDFIIKKGSKRISVKEIEQILKMNELIVDVAVLIYDDSIHGQSFKAFIVLKKGASLTLEDIMKYCRNKLAEYKIPREMKIIKNIPRNPNGKVIYDKLI